MEMQFKNEIKKLADIVVWFDDWIEEIKLDLTEEDMEDDTTIKEFETIKKVILESIERHNVYTSALNKDLADKSAKIELLEKEIEGRKEGYWALKEKYDKLEKELADCNVKIRHQKENLDGINKTLEIRTKENESLVKVRNNLNKEIEAHESENARLTEKIMKLHNTITELSHDIDNYKSWNADLHRDIKELKKKKEDDHGKSGFKRYIEHLIEEEERAVPERFKERLNQEITEIFTKKEETEVEVDKSKNYGPIPESVRSARRAAKVNDIPCGEDSIE